MEHLEIKVYGVVQGVSFRYYTKNKADKLGVTGFVRNDLDGSVYIEAEAGKEVLEKFLEWCKGDGSPWSEVFRVEFEFSNDLKNFADFEIRY